VHTDGLSLVPDARLASLLVTSRIATYEFRRKKFEIFLLKNFFFWLCGQAIFRPFLANFTLYHGPQFTSGWPAVVTRLFQEIFQAIWPKIRIFS
jgi:hypothetical protein